MLRSQASFPEIIEKMDLDIELDGIELHSSYLSLQRQTLILHPIKNECDDIIVDKDRFVLGRSKSRTDYPLSMSPSISNVHCRFTRNANLFFVEDMQSRNGTYINDNKLTPMLACAINDGDVLKLKTKYAKDIEIKTDKGNQGCRRKLTRCNDLPMATLNVGSLPVEKGDKDVVTEQDIKDEKHLRNKIVYAIQKKGDIVSTAVGINYIYDVLDKAYIRYITA
jgi:pSer/pThr/pTyr-binding forkhead associated (FHA) protein